MSWKLKEQEIKSWFAVLLISKMGMLTLKIADLIWLQHTPRDMNITPVSKSIGKGLSLLVEMKALSWVRGRGELLRDKSCTVLITSSLETIQMRVLLRDSPGKGLLWLSSRWLATLREKLQEANLISGCWGKGLGRLERRRQPLSCPYSQLATPETLGKY